MKSLLLISSLFLSMHVTGDTIDVWHVYYNDLKIEEFNTLSNGEIILKALDIKATDTLTVKYFSDTPCHDCEVSLTYENGKHKPLATTTSHGTGTALKMSVAVLRETEQEEFEVFYTRDNMTSRWQRPLLFRLRIE